MAKPRKVRVAKVFDRLNWWNHDTILGKVFDVVEVAPALDDSRTLLVNIEYGPERYGWIPLEMCEVNPHLRRVQ